MYPNAHHNPHHNLGPDGGTLGDAFKQGKVDLWLRWRLEDVEDDIPAASPIANADKAQLAQYAYCCRLYHCPLARILFTWRR